MSRNGYSLLIVDDEEWIRRGLLAKVGKSGLPISEVREAGDAESAWKIVDEIPPDLVLCDIRMAGTDGLDLCERISRSFPETRLILVSGYDDFDYARRALHLAAVDYLLKPVEAYELYRALKKAIDDLERRRALSVSIAGAELAARRERFKEIAESGAGLSSEGVREFLRDYREGESLFRAMCLLHPFERYDRAHRDPASIVSTFADWNEGRNLIWYPDRIGGTTFILCHDERPGVEERVLRLAEALCAEDGGAGAAAGALGLAAPGRSIERSVGEAARLAKHRTLLARGGIIRAEDAAEWKNEYTIQADRILVLEGALRLRDETRISEILADVRREIEEGRASYGCASKVFRHLLLLAEEGGAPESPSSSSPEAPELFAFRNLEEAFRSLSGAFGRAAASNARSAAAPHAAMIHAIREHIDAHFAEPLSLKELAARSRVNPSYLSEVFHRAIGMTFQDYVTKTRIDHAKLLLATGKCRMSEVAERTGFSDHNYFSKVFRRLTGLSPSEFGERERASR